MTTVNGTVVLERTGETTFTMRPDGIGSTTSRAPTGLGVPTPGPGGLPGTTIAGIVVGSLAGVAGLVGMIVVCWMLGRRKGKIRRIGTRMRGASYKPYGGRFELSEEARKKIDEADGSPVYELEGKILPAEIEAEERKDDDRD